ncbi:MAG: carbohydrate ABC transporter permease [Acidobacteriota bacterium]
MTRGKTAAASLALHLALGLLALATLLPLIWMVSASFMPPGEATTDPPPFFPSRLTLENYHNLFARLSLGRHLLNSLGVAVGGTLLSLLFNSMAGYAFAKLRFGGRDRIFAILIAALAIPGQVGMLPLFLLMRQLGLVNTYLGVVIPSLASILGIFLVRQFALSIPDELLDAARVDGAGELRIFASVVLPLMRPVLATLAIITFMNTWNDFLWPLIVLTDDARQTLPVALARLVGEHALDTELMMAGAVLTVLPVLLVFLALQRSYIEGILMGSVKG